ncbi:MAG TPA: 2-hydroxyacyl-CoA dehydratase [Paracoccus solventivorans]|uniref:2-hydroxyacyl-CoA dehydratase n=1 Tax=Paracoccus solventivorans TaxID=53463 RepID=A0A832PJY6_9RHOB|nr:2-hydroxyacyl-CoA dehydratase family protein [Paracoccus solventivorans]HHW32903.1 2-hydroxyacyl-CoA dehydratase [Paracoccus solventivorans]
MDEILATMAAVAADPLGYARQWKQETQGRVIGLFPMHFPGELAHAAGALPVILQEDDEPVTVGQAQVFNFYCGYNRSIIDQALRGEFEVLDAILFGDHCVQLLGTADVIRASLPKMPILFNQLCSILDADWAKAETTRTFSQLWKELETLIGQPIAPAQVQASIRLFNRNRALIRELYDLRRAGQIALTGRQMQDIVKSSMVMDRAQHTALLEKLVPGLERRGPPADAVRVFLSGHLCHAPKLPVLDLVEECGGVVVDDDLYHGFRFVFWDVAETGDPVEALADWYLLRSTKVPCPTRAVKSLDWEDYLLRNVRASGAQGLIVLMAKFCEPHMYFYPEIKDAFDRNGIPHLLVETEHEEMPMEALKTRVETFIEIAKRRMAA